ncbi:Glutamine ABC transporter, periplasmic glutamine-binding protein [Euzebya pacifica]|uniref:Glutamine ABC transporter, periplasmic glutamine-binding protein n=1 Tax=Euzebya pacifica TaxID=1608957 RepID=A0A346XXT6_9ACTN|nr:transporter substrate-binding domain-containing protein [Euzebya pacifica]AXV07033.1 Glutamine ABC transporter, periplasmic glutamine-binding protein [Euzebya pacifica]
MSLARALRVLAAAMILALALAACSSDDSTETDDASGSATSTADEAAGDDEEAAEEAAPADLTLVSEGNLTVCTEAPYAPFEVEDPDSDTGFGGFDIDIVDEVATRLGLELAVINTGFDALTSGTAMASGTCDMAISAMTITEEREENIDFSDPYYNAAQSLMVPADSGITALADVEGRLGVQSGTTGEAYATENAPDTAELVAFDAGADLFTALAANDIVGILQDLPVNIDRAQQDDSLSVVETYETDEEYGMAFEQDANPELIEAINGALSAMREDGTYDTIYDSYFSES